MLEQGGSGVRLGLGLWVLMVGLVPGQDRTEGAGALSRELGPWLVGRTLSRLSIHRWVLGAHVGPPWSPGRVMGAKLFLQGLPLYCPQPSRLAQGPAECAHLSPGR